MRRTIEERLADAQAKEERKRERRTKHEALGRSRTDQRIRRSREQTAMEVFYSGGQITCGWEPLPVPKMVRVSLQVRKALDNWRINCRFTHEALAMRARVPTDLILDIDRQNDDGLVDGPAMVRLLAYVGDLRR